MIRGYGAATVWMPNHQRGSIRATPATLRLVGIGGATDLARHRAPGVVGHLEFVENRDSAKRVSVDGSTPAWRPPATTAASEPTNFRTKAGPRAVFLLGVAG